MPATAWLHLLFLQAHALDTFNRYDVVGNGQLAMPELASFLRTLLPRMDKKDLR